MTQSRRPRTLVAPVIMGAFKAPYSERLTSELPQLALDFHKSLQRDPYKPIGERMTAHMIDGKALAAELSQGIADAVRRVTTEHGIEPGLAVVLVGDNPASEIYVRSKTAKTARISIPRNDRRLWIPARSSMSRDRRSSALTIRKLKAFSRALSKRRRSVEYRA
jgi:Tetrahydrofolate dehydrogenase/cyclohydrolase, catalytic domain